MIEFYSWNYNLFFSVCDESIVNSSSENQEKITEKINKLNNVLNELFQRWTNNLSQLREIAVAIIQFGNYKNMRFCSFYKELEKDVKEFSKRARRLRNRFRSGSDLLKCFHPNSEDTRCFFLTVYIRLLIKDLSGGWIYTQNNERALNFGYLRKVRSWFYDAKDHSCCVSADISSDIFCSILRNKN
jgi:hypothetical protein